MSRFRVTDDGHKRTPSGQHRSKPTGAAPSIEALARDLAVKHGRALSVAPANGPHRYWRVGDATNPSPGAEWVINEIELLDSGNVNRALLVTPTAEGGISNSVITELTDGDLTESVGAGAYSGFHNPQAGKWFVFDLGASHTITKVRLYSTPNDTPQYVAPTWKVQYSDNGTTWTAAGTYTGSASARPQILDL